MDWTDIISVIITTVGTLAGVYVLNSKAQAVTEVKIEELTREVREHNNFAQRVPILEEKIERLEKYHPIKPE